MKPKTPQFPYLLSAYKLQNAAFKSFCPNAPDNGNFDDPPPYEDDVPGDPKP